MESKRTYFRRLVERGLSEGQALESMARSYERRSAQSVAELRREVGLPPVGSQTQVSK
jgi:hypothetical protein